MARKAAKEAAKKKAAKQKKLLILLGVMLVGAMVFAFTTLSNLNKSPQASGSPAATTNPDGSVPTGTNVAAIIPGISAPAVGSLHALTMFGRKDPFNDHGPSGATASTAPSKNGNGNGSGTTKQPPVPLTGAVISINGNKLSLALGAQFGRAPGLSGVWLFRLVKLTRTTALIAVVGTHQQFTLQARRPLTLQQNGGWNYTLILEPLGSAAPMTVQPTTTTTGP